MPVVLVGWGGLEVWGLEGGAGSAEGSIKVAVVLKWEVWGVGLSLLESCIEQGCD